MKSGPFWLEIRRVDAETRSEAAYDALYQETSLAQIESFYLWLMEEIRPQSQSWLIDVSCGAGDLLKSAERHHVHAVGVDISHVVARKALDNTQRHATIGVAAGEHLPFADASFDTVTCIGSLEHFMDMAQGVREMARILRRGGKAFILVPNTFSLLVNIWLAFRKGITVADQQPIQRYGARADWTTLLESNGLKVLQTKKYERPRPRTWRDVIFVLRRPKEMLRLLATPWVPVNLAFHFLFICEKL